jgi:hypothetical protein
LKLKNSPGSKFWNPILGWYGGGGAGLWKLDLRLSWKFISYLYKIIGVRTCLIR